MIWCDKMALSGLVWNGFGVAWRGFMFEVRYVMCELWCVEIE